jgi:hypothetical protein
MCVLVSSEPIGEHYIMSWTRRRQKTLELVFHERAPDLDVLLQRLSIALGTPNCKNS